MPRRKIRRSYVRDLGLWSRARRELENVTSRQDLRPWRQATAALILSFWKC